VFLGPLVVVRHGETEWSRLGRHTGRTDLELTEVGRAQARAAAPVIAELLDGRRIGRVLTSPRRRAMHTAKLVLSEPAVIDERLAEFDYGDYEGLLTDEILFRDPSWNLWRSGCPGGESPIDVAARCDALLAELDDSAAEAVPDAVVVFCHGHLSRALVSRAVGWPVEAAGSLENGTASVALVGGHKGHRVLRVWNRQGVVSVTT
jgi:broad specificity phosphatase PhoE